MKISVFSDELHYDVAKALPIISSWGSKCVDFRGRVNGRGIEFQTAEELSELAALVKANNLTTAVLQTSLCKVHLPDKERQAEEMEKLEGIIRAADALDCRLVRCFNYWQPHTAPDVTFGDLIVRPDEMDRVLNAFAPIAKRAKEAGLILAFENCGQTAAEAIAFAEALGVPEWGLAWDVQNHLELVPGAPEDCNAYYEKCIEHAKLLHVKACSILPECKGIKPPWERILSAVEASGKELPVSMETHTPKDSGMTGEECTHKVYSAVLKAMPSGAPTTVHQALAKKQTFPRSYSDNPVKYVVVGLGMGRSRCRQLRDTDGCQLYGVVDINAEKAKAVGEEFGVKYSSDINDFLNDPEVEVMYTVVPTGLHGQVSEQCLRAGKHVLTTKPMDVSVENCQSMIKTAKETGRLLGVDFDMRYDEHVLALKKAVENGWFGHLLSVHATLHIHRSQDYYDENGAWRGTWRYDGGGAMCNQGVHEIDVMQYILGMPKRVRATIATQARAIETEDIGFAEWDYGNNLIVRFFSTTTYPLSTWYTRVEMHGTKGAYVQSSGGPEGNGIYYGKDNKWTSEEPYPVKRVWQQGSDAFASAVRLGTPLVTPAEEGIKSRMILDAMYKSAKSGGSWQEV